MTASNPRRWIYLVAACLIAAVQSGIILFVVESRASVLRDGADLMLRSAPIDPRDLLRGDYVVLSYDIATIAANRITGAWPQGRGSHDIFVRLGPEADGFFTVREASFDPLPASDGTQVVKGTVKWLPAPGSDHTVTVKYGIERYYVPEGEGRDIESARNEGRVSVAARVSPSGVVRIRALLLDGKPLYEEPLY